MYSFTTAATPAVRKRTWLQGDGGNAADVLSLEGLPEFLLYV